MNVKKLLLVTALAVALVLSAASPVFAGYRSFTLRNGQWNDAVEDNEAYESDFGGVSDAHYFVRIPEHCDQFTHVLVPESLSVVVAVWRNNRAAYNYRTVKVANILLVEDKRLPIPRVQFSGLDTNDVSCIIKYNPYLHVIGGITAPASWYMPDASN